MKKCMNEGNELEVVGTRCSEQFLGADRGRFFQILSFTDRQSSA